jgi:hypothetical protein
MLDGIVNLDAHQVGGRHQRQHKGLHETEPNPSNWEVLAGMVESECGHGGVEAAVMWAPGNTPVATWLPCDYAEGITRRS